MSNAGRLVSLPHRPVPALALVFNPEHVAFGHMADARLFRCSGYWEQRERGADIRERWRYHWPERSTPTAAVSSGADAE